MGRYHENRDNGPYTLTVWSSNTKSIEWALAHLKGKGIPAGIVSRRSGTEFAVWRTGVEYGAKAKSRIAKDMAVVASCHGFEEVFLNAKKEVMRVR